MVNLSHSGDDIALLMSDEGEVGCDIEVIRPRKNWQALANAVFSMTEHDELEREAPEERLSAFWRIWTRKEAIVKQRGGSAWQIVSIDSTAQTHAVSQLQVGSLSLAVCTSTPYTLNPRIDYSRWDVRGRKITNTPRIINPTPTSPCQEKRSPQPAAGSRRPHQNIAEAQQGIRFAERHAMQRQIPAAHRGHVPRQPQQQRARAGREVPQRGNKRQESH